MANPTVTLLFAEELHDESYLGLFMCMNAFTDTEVDLTISAFA